MGGRQGEARPRDGAGLAGRLAPTPAHLFLYALTVSGLAFAAHCRSALLALALVNAVPGLALGARRYPLLVALLLLGFLGTFLNAILVANTGPPAYHVGPLVVREGAIEAGLRVVLRISSITGASLVFLGLARPRDTLRSLEEELGLPKGVAFATALSLRLFTLAREDAKWITGVRRLRGARRIPLTPRDYESLAMPLLSVLLERAHWVGVTAELRGFSLRPRRRPRPRLTLGGALLLLLAALQVIAVLQC